MLLVTPGPTRVPERVLGAGARPMLHHRSPEFSAELATMLELLSPVFGTRGVVLPVHATGRGAMEAAVCNLFSTGDEIAVCCNTVTAIALPAGVSPAAVRDGVKARGILTAAALGPYQATALRIGHMGDIRPADVERTLAALAGALAECASSDRRASR